MKKRSDYIVTNILKIDDFSDIIINDLKLEINTKYNLAFSKKQNIEHTLVSSPLNGVLFNGWDIGFDIIRTK